MQFVPVMSFEKFAELSGFTKPTVDMWHKRGYIPTQKIGKRLVVDVAAMTFLAHEREAEFQEAVQNAVG